MGHRHLIAVAALCVFGWTVPVAGAAPTWLPVQTVSDPAHAVTSFREQVAMGPVGDIAAAWSEGKVIAAAVRPAGGSFSFRETISDLGHYVDMPSVAVNATGEVAVAWSDSTDHQIEVAVRSPGGSFSAPLQAGSTAGTIPQFTSVAIDAAGDVLVAVPGYNGAHSTASYAWRPAGGTFTPVALSEVNTNTLAPVVAMNGAGDAVVTWGEENSGSHYVTRVSTRPAGGVFGPAQALSDGSQNAYEQAAAVSSGGHIAVAWSRSDGTNPRVQVSTSTSPSTLFSTAQTVSAAGGKGEYPAIAVSANGGVVAAWEQIGATSVVGEMAGGSVGGSFGLVTELDSGSGYMQAAMDDAGDAVVAWVAGNEITTPRVVRAIVRPASGVIGTPVTLSSPGDKMNNYSNVPATTAGIDRAGDAVVGWMRFNDSTVQTRIYDATAPALSLSGPTTVTAGQAVSFSAASADLFSAVVAPVWSFGDGATTSGNAPSHVYGTPGTYTVTATATDAVGNATSASRQITVLAAPAPVPTPLVVKTQCRVPRLKGLTRGAASRRLTAAHCRLGKVNLARRYRHTKRLVVASQSPAPGKQLAIGAKVSITLRPPPPAHHRR